MPKHAVTDRFGSLSRLDEAPKATFPPVLLRQRGAIGVMRMNRACSISMRRERIEFFQIPGRMAIGGRTRPGRGYRREGRGTKSWPPADDRVPMFLPPQIALRNGGLPIRRADRGRASPPGRDVANSEKTPGRDISAQRRSRGRRLCRAHRIRQNRADGRYDRATCRYRASSRRFSISSLAPLYDHPSPRNPDFQARAGEIRYVAWARAIGEIVIGHDLQARPAALANPSERFAMTTGVAQSLGNCHRVAMPVRPALLQGDEGVNVMPAVGDRLAQTDDPVCLRAPFPVPVRVLDRPRDRSASMRRSSQ